MANLLSDIITYLVSQGVATGDGTDCFRDNLPPSPDAVVALFEYPGGGTQPGVDCTDRNIQVQARAATYAAARTKIYSVYNVLNVPLDPIKQLTLTRRAVINSRGGPFKLLQDANDRTVFACNLTITTLQD